MVRTCAICNCCETNIENIHNFELTLVNDMNLNNHLDLKYCNKCKFYFSDSNNCQEDYNKYYMNFNNYKNENYCKDKDVRCFDYLLKKLPNEVKNILDYGSGNGTLAELLSNKFNVEQFDIGMEQNTNKYDCLVVSHVLEHIYDLNSFIEKISENINDNGFLYIEIPNAEFYDKIVDMCPLQEINLEHINFFSKYALNKLLIHHNYTCLTIEDDYFLLKDMKYYVIRGIFKKSIQYLSIQKYIQNGLMKINEFNFQNLQKFKSIYVYGCGQFLFKIFDKIQNNCTIINIVDDNTCYLNKKIKNIEIINFELLKDKITKDDVILLTTMIHDEKIKQKLNTLNISINIIEIMKL
jgi:hypothetical protein